MRFEGDGFVVVQPYGEYSRVDTLSNEKPMKENTGKGVEKNAFKKGS